MLKGNRYARKVINILRDYVKCCECGCNINKKTDKHYLKCYKYWPIRIIMKIWVVDLEDRTICKSCNRNMKLKKLI